MNSKIAIDDFRKYLVKYQSLCTSTELQGKVGVLSYIKRVGCIQYDALNVVGRNADLVLQSRISDYSPNYLYELLYEDRKLVDELDKVMSIFSVEDWPYFQSFREAAKFRYGSNPKLLEIIEDVRQTIRDKGPVTSDDLEYKQSVAWSWAPTKLSRAALESMYFWGELIIEKKINARKVYDFANKLINLFYKLLILTAQKKIFLIGIFLGELEQLEHYGTNQVMRGLVFLILIKVIERAALSV